MINVGNFIKIIDRNELEYLLKFYNCISDINEDVLQEISSNYVEILSIPSSSPTLDLSSWDGMIQIRTLSNKEIMLPYAALLGKIDERYSPELEEKSRPPSQPHPIYNVSSLDTSSTYSLKSIMGRVVTNIPHPLPQHAIKSIPSISYSSQTTLTITDICLLKGFNIEYRNLYLQFTHNDWRYQSEVQSNMQRYPILWGDCITRNYKYSEYNKGNDSDSIEGDYAISEDVNYISIQLYGALKSPSDDVLLGIAKLNLSDLSPIDPHLVELNLSCNEFDCGVIRFRIVLSSDHGPELESHASHINRHNREKLQCKDKLLPNHCESEGTSNQNLESSAPSKLRSDQNVRDSAVLPVIPRRPRSALPTGVASFGCNSKSPKETQKRPTSAAKRTKQQSHYQPIPVSFGKNITTADLQGISMEIRGNKFQKESNSCESKILHDMGEPKELFYHRTITTDQTPSSAIMEFSSEVKIEGSVKVDQMTSLNILSVDIPSPRNNPPVPQLPSPFAQQRLNPSLEPTSCTERDKTYLNSYLQQLNVHPDRYRRQVDRSLQLTIWEDFYMILLPRCAILSRNSCNRFHLFQEFILSKKLNCKEFILISLINPTDFAITFLGITLDEITPDLLKESESLLRLTISTLIGPWKSIRQLILNETTKTNIQPRKWSSSFLLTIFKELDMPSKYLDLEISVEQFLFSSDPPSLLVQDSRDDTTSTSTSNRGGENLYFCELIWKLYRRVLYYLDDWWNIGIYPPDIIYLEEQFHVPALVSLPCDESEFHHQKFTPTYITPFQFKNKDLIRISSSQKLFRLYISLSRVYSWSYATNEKLLRLSDLISHQVGTVITSIPHSLHKRTINYSNMNWIYIHTSSSNESSNLSSRYFETTLGSLCDIEPVHGKYVLVPVSCLKLISPTCTSKTLTTLPISLLDIPKDNIITGMSIQVVSFHHLCRVYDRIPWWDRPTITTLQTISEKFGFIVSTVSLLETNRVGVTLKDSNQNDITEVIPIDALIVRPSSSPEPVMEGLPTDNQPNDSPCFDIVDEHDDHPHTLSSPINDEDQSPQVLERINSHETELPAPTTIAPVKISFCEQHKNKQSQVKSHLKSPVSADLLLPICQSDTDFFEEKHPQAIRPLYRAMTARDLDFDSKCFQNLNSLQFKGFPTSNLSQVVENISMDHAPPMIPEHTSPLISLFLDERAPSEMSSSMISKKHSLHEERFHHSLDHQLSPIFVQVKNSKLTKHHQHDNKHHVNYKLESQTSTLNPSRGSHHKRLKSFKISGSKKKLERSSSQSTGMRLPVRSTHRDDGK